LITKVPVTGQLLAHAKGTVERWKDVSEHPGVVGLRGAFLSREMDDAAALFLAYDFAPSAVRRNNHNNHNDIYEAVVREAPSAVRNNKEVLVRESRINREIDLKPLSDPGRGIDQTVDRTSNTKNRTVPHHGPAECCIEVDKQIEVSKYRVRFREREFYKLMETTTM
jgi:hypothetical protein